MTETKKNSLIYKIMVFMLPFYAQHIKKTTELLYIFTSNYKDIKDTLGNNHQVTLTLIG